MELTRYLKIYPLAGSSDRFLLYATRRAALLEVSEGLLKRAENGALNEQEQSTLAGMGFLVTDRDAEREELRDTFVRGNTAARPFTAMVTLTLECNLACPYCYEEPFRSRQRMTPESADLLIALARDHMAAGRDVIFDFYGGEALMALPMIRRISGPLRDEAARRGVSYRFNLISNGVLLNRAVAEELALLGLVSAKLTLDGPREIHDRQRPFVSGVGSFDRIVANISETWDLVSLQLGGNYTSDNYRRFPELLDYLPTQGITPEKLSLVMFGPVTPKSDGTTATDFSATCACTDEAWVIEASLFLRAEILRRGFNAPRLRPTGCMIEFENDLVVAHDGGLFKCPAFMGDEHLRVGTLADGVGDYRQSHLLDSWKCPECLDCAYLPLCFGGCRFLRRLRSGSIDGLDCRKEYWDATLKEIITQDLTLRK